MVFDTIVSPAKVATHVKRPHKQITRVTCIRPVKRSKFTCFFAASTSHSVHATAHIEARKVRVTSPAGCGQTYLHFEVEFNSGVVANCLPTLVFLAAFGGSFACNCGYYWVFILPIACFLACKVRQFYKPVASKLD